jgi:ribosomal protein S1
MIGEQFDEGDEICGAVVSVRAKQDKISIWTKTASNEAAQVQNEAHVFLSVLMFQVLIIVVSIKA